MSDAIEITVRSGLLAALHSAYPDWQFHFANIREWTNGCELRATHAKQNTEHTLFIFNSGLRDWSAEIWAKDTEAHYGDFLRTGGCESPNAPLQISADS